MKELEKEPNIIGIAKKCARVSLVIGTLLFLVASLAKLKALLMVGFLFSLIAFMVNGLVLFILLLHLIGFPNFRKEVLHTIFLMLFNIPVTILYAWIILGRTGQHL